MAQPWHEARGRELGRSRGLSTSCIFATHRTLGPQLIESVNRAEKTVVTFCAPGPYQRISFIKEHFFFLSIAITALQLHLLT